MERRDIPSTPPTLDPSAVETSSADTPTAQHPTPEDHKRSWRQLAELAAQQIKARAKSTFYDLYLRKLQAELPSWETPAHIGIVMDGNRRFAKAVGAASVVEGHHKGADKLDEVLGWCEEANVRVVTVWGFSMDNFSRPLDEFQGLMSLFERKFLELVTDPRIHRDQIRVHSLGRVELLPPAVQHAIREAERATAHYKRKVLNVGVAYGGREEIIDGFQSYLAAAERQGLSLQQAREQLSPASLSPHLYTSHVPDPDLIIRTSGEVRLSGFLLWQSAYSEFYFCDVHWPAFRKIDFLRALRAYHQRQRRFGR
jgi:undecaprenyl diphosphate synthase